MTMKDKHGNILVVGDYVKVFTNNNEAGVGSILTIKDEVCTCVDCNGSILMIAEILLPNGIYRRDYTELELLSEQEVVAYLLKN